jgi:pimeloyl-ACP methyl ester carboxylesterase
MNLRLSAWVLILGLWLSSDRSAHAQPALGTYSPPRIGIVFVINGSGDATSISDNFAQIFPARDVPLAIYTIRWCRHARLAKDHADYDAQIMAASRLAHLVADYRAAHPDEKIFLISHSAGAHVLLEAMNLLPPNSVDRIILMASSVSYSYDLRSALRCSRGGIDALFSTEDRLVALGSELMGTADKKQVQPAGEVGFGVPSPTHPDAGLYANLRQYRWHPGLAWTGHRGGHSGFTCLGFLDACVLPMMLGPVDSDQ